MPMTIQDLTRIEQVYDDVACEYAKEFAGEHEKKPKDQEMLKKFAQLLQGRSPVWEFGCGPGHTACYLRNLGFEISGLDLSENTLAGARAAYPGILFRKGNMLELDFAENSIAGILAFYAIVHFTSDQVKKAFQEIHRVLQPGGIFLFTFHVGEGPIHVDVFLGKPVNIDWMLFNTDSINRYLKEIGFVAVEAVERDPYPEVEYPSRRAYVFASKKG
jgi:SAM-dependent methyltransferase